MKKLIPILVLFIVFTDQAIAQESVTASQTSGPQNQALPYTFTSIYSDGGSYTVQNIYLVFSQPVYISVSNISGWQPNSYLGGYWLASNGSDTVYSSEITPPTGYIGPITSLDVNGDGASQFSFTVTALTSAPTTTPTVTPTETLTPTPTDTPTPTATPTTLYTPMPTDDGLIGAESAITIPYHFEAIVFGNSDLPPLPTVDLISTDFINQTGSIALTLYNLFDQYQVIAIFMVLLLAVAVIFWLYSFVTKTPSSVALRVTDIVGTAAQVSNAYGNYLDEKSTDFDDTADRIEDYAVKDEHMDAYTKNYQFWRAKSFRSEGERLKKQSDKFKNLGRGFNQGARAVRQAKKINPYK